MSEGTYQRVGSLAEAVAALDAARAAGGAALLESPPACAGFHGIGWWLALLDEAKRAVPGVPLDAVLDCGSAPGLALAALRAGVGVVRVAAPDAALAALRSIAAGLGAVVLAADRPAITDPGRDG